MGEGDSRGKGQVFPVVLALREVRRSEKRTGTERKEE